MVREVTAMFPYCTGSKGAMERKKGSSPDKVRWSDSCVSSDICLPIIVDSEYRKNRKSKKGNLNNVSNSLLNRKSDRVEKRWSIKPWDAGSPTDDGIVSWVKRQTQLEAKRGKKRSLFAETEHHFPVNKTCSEISDVHTFKAQSLHDRFLPNAKKQKTSCVQDQGKGPVYRYTSKSRLAQSEAGGHASSLRLQRSSDDGQVGSSMDLPGVAAQSMTDLRGRGSPDLDIIKGVQRSASVLEYHSSKQQEVDKYNSKSTSTYHKIKRILKFSKFGENKRQHSNVGEEDEDEGYSSKTSSAEIKDKDPNPVEYPALHRMYSSLVDLSELSVPETTLNGYQRFKFNYTHQDSPRAPQDVESERLEREKTVQIALRLQRLTTDPVRCSHINHVNTLPPEETTLIDLNSDSTKPVTLILRKISIQDSEKCVPEQVMRTVTTPTRISDRPVSQAGSRPGSTTQANSRLGSADKRQRVTYSRPASYKSRSSTSASEKPPSPAVAANPDKEPHWSPKMSQPSYYDKNPNACSIGDLLPAMDRSIYGKQAARSNTQIPSQENAASRSEAEPEIPSPRKATTSQQAEYTMLRKGMDVIAGAIEKCRKARTHLPTLGPPPFRPNQTRHPLTRDVTVVLDMRNSKANPYQYQLRASPTLGTNRRVGSDKGPRPQQENPDKETRKKLREAFTRFYNQRPKDVGKEFRRMQTMWNT